MAYTRNPKRVMQTRKNARRQNAFAPKPEQSNVSIEQPNQSGGECPQGLQPLRGADGRMRCVPTKKFRRR